MYDVHRIIGSVHVYRYSTKSDNTEIEKTVTENNLKINGNKHKSNYNVLNYEKEDVLVKGKYTENREVSVKTQSFELETVLSPTKTTPYSYFGHTHHVTGKYNSYGRHGKRHRHGKISFSFEFVNYLFTSFIIVSLYHIFFNRLISSLLCSPCFLLFSTVLCPFICVSLWQYYNTSFHLYHYVENFTFISSYAENGSGQVGVFERSSGTNNEGEIITFHLLSLFLPLFLSITFLPPFLPSSLPPSFPPSLPLTILPSLLPSPSPSSSLVHSFLSSLSFTLHLSKTLTSPFIL